MTPTDSDIKNIVKDDEKVEEQIKTKKEDIEDEKTDESKIKVIITEDNKNDNDIEQDKIKIEMNDENKNDIICKNKVTKQPASLNTKEESPFLSSISTEKKGTFNETIKQKLEATNSTAEIDGQNSENVIFSADCNLYRFVVGKTTLEARGVGKIFIVKVEESGLYKLVMNRDKINRLGCNHYISPLVELQPHSKINDLWIWHTFTDTCDKDAKLDAKQTFAVRIKVIEDFKLFKEKYDWARDQNKKEYENKNKN